MPTYRCIAYRSNRQRVTNVIDRVVTALDHFPNLCLAFTPDVTVRTQDHDIVGHVRLVLQGQ